MSLKKDGVFRYMDSDIYFHGIKEGEICEVQLNEGKVMVVKLVEIRKPDENGNREPTFQVDGLLRTILIKDKAAQTKATKQSILMAEVDNDHEIGANIPGNIVKVLVKEGETVEDKQPIAVIEAMKMETNILATAKGIVEKIHVSEGQQVKAGEMIAKLV